MAGYRGLGNPRSIHDSEDEKRISEVSLYIYQHCTFAHAHRFFVHPLCNRLASALLERFGPANVEAMVFSSAGVAKRCHDWMAEQAVRDEVGHFSLGLPDSANGPPTVLAKWADAHVVWFKPDHFKLAKAYWQHTGEGMSSRRAEYCLRFADQYQLATEISKRPFKAVENVATPNVTEDAQAYIASEIGRYLGGQHNIQASRDVFIHLSGMKCCADLAQAIQRLAIHPQQDSVHMIAFGFLYVDTFKILTRFNGFKSTICGHGNSADLDDLERSLASGHRITALFTEFPTNPLLTCVDLSRIRRLADQYSFLVVIDDTVGTSVNTNIFSHADVVWTSLTKLFSGKCDVMGGVIAVNPSSRWHEPLLRELNAIKEDLYFPQDAVTMASNCQNFDKRVRLASQNAQAVVDLLQSNDDLVKQVYYPSVGPSKQIYDQFKRPNEGYGFLLSFRLHDMKLAVAFFDNLDVAKGPSLGTDFTLACPYTYFAHYGELEWAASYGVVEDLIRISVGIENDIVPRVKAALEAAREILEPSG